jgi:hypothetical protein
MAFANERFSAHVYARSETKQGSMHNTTIERLAKRKFTSDYFSYAQKKNSLIQHSGCHSWLKALNLLSNLKKDKGLLLLR